MVRPRSQSVMPRPARTRINLFFLFPFGGGLTDKPDKFRELLLDLTQNEGLFPYLVEFKLSHPDLFEIFARKVEKVLCLSRADLTRTSRLDSFLKSSE